MVAAGALLENVSTAVITAVVSITGAYLVYRRNLRKDASSAKIEDNKVAIEASRAANEMLAEYAERMERRLDKADSDLYVVRKELIDMKTQAALCKAEIEVLKSQIARIMKVGNE